MAGRDSKRAVLVVSGNLHPRQVKGLPWNPDYRPMGLRIADQYSPVYSLDIAYDSGTAWLCSLDEQRELDCGVKLDGRSGQGYHGIFYAAGSGRGFSKLSG